jgi:septum formation protein
MKIILGSASKWRKQILEKAGYNFKVMEPNIDERKIRHNDPEKLVLELAYAKADVLIPQIKEQALLITADQVVLCNGHIYEKPNSAQEAREFIHSYARYPAQTITAVVVTNTKTNKQASGVDIVNINFKPIPEFIIDQLIAKGEIFSCAGGFQIEDENGNLNPYIRNIDGAIDSVKGLPIKLMEDLIQIIY